MKLEARGKYAGVKVHLDKDECLAILTPVSDAWLERFCMKLKRKIEKLQKETPRLLEDKTEEEVIAALSKEAVESKLKLDAIGASADWKKVKVEVLK